MAPPRRGHGRPRVCIVRQTDLYEPPVHRTARALRAEGFDVEVIMMAHPDHPDREVVEGVEVTRLPVALGRCSRHRYLLDYSIFFARVAATLTRRHLSRPYAVVQVNTMPDFLVFAAAVPRLLGARVFLFMNEPMPELAATLYGSSRVTRVLEAIERRAIAFADHTYAVTEQLALRYVERGARPDRVTVVLNGADPAVRFGNWTPRRRPADRDTFTIICHGTIEDRMGQDTIVDAVALLRDELPDLRLVLTGRGSAVDSLLARVKRYGLQDVVSFEGWVSHDRMNDLLHDADVGVVAQKASPYSHLVQTNKMVDFWLFGLPAIATRLESVSNLHDNSVIEYYEPGNAQDLARALRRLHGDPGRRDELVRNGRRALERHGWAVQRKAYLRPYRALVQARAA